ncbi:MAG: hypothetical protein GY866_12970 [Proteobacteria bacterium]|nr:hypothetical protein [Pseudomonadota bacterium]
MSTRKTCEMPARLRGVRGRFERWRKIREGRARIPDSLWAAAVKVASVYGVSRTARVLGVDYYTLKERVEQEFTNNSGVSEGDNPDGTGATFLELAPLAPTGLCQCTLELENAGGSKMRVHFQGSEAPDLTSLSRSFWELDS